MQVPAFKSIHHLQQRRYHLMAKRFLTLFGVPIPPWRDQDGAYWSGATTIKFVIKGYIPSKKNNQQAVSRRREAVEFLKELFKKNTTINKAQAFEAIKKVTAKMRGNSRYVQFLEDQKAEMERQRKYWLSRLESKGLTFPVSKAMVNIRFYFAQKYRQDSLNKQQSVQDLLKDTKIIFDDDYLCINPIKGDADCFSGEITQNIVVISITVKLSANGKEIQSGSTPGDAEGQEPA